MNNEDRGRYEGLHLRPFRKGDADVIVNWIRDEEGFYKWSAGRMGPYPLTPDALLQAMAGREDNDRFFPFVMTDGDRVIGFFILRHPGESRDELRFGFIIVDAEIKGKGYGKKMLELGMRYAYDVYGAKKVSLGVFANNPSAYHCYKSVGFTENGMVEDYEMNGYAWQCIELERAR